MGLSRKIVRKISGVNTRKAQNVYTVTAARPDIFVNWKKSPPMSKKLVFVVEDNPVQQKMLQVHFEQMLGDYTVRTFADPEDMLTHLKEKPFTVVLDHFFDDRNAKTGLHYLKHLRKNFPSIPVIYYTTLDDAAVRSDVMSLGAEQYIIKDSASLVRLRTALDSIVEKDSNKGFFSRLFGG